MTDVSHIDWETAHYNDRDLVPGDSYEVAVLGRQLRDTAALIEKQSANLRNLVDGNGWDSDAGHKFQEKVSDAADKLAKAHERYHAAAQALGTDSGGSPESNWASALEHAQDLARKALVKGKDARQESSSYAKSIAQAKDDTSPAAVRMHDQKSSADADLLQAQRDLEAALHFRDEQAHKAARAIRDAIDHDGLKDPEHHWWDTALDWVAKIGHWAGVAAAFLGVAALLLSWVPVLGEVLAALALVASVVALVCDTVSALDGRGTWLDVAIDAIGVLSFGAGRILGTAAREASVAARASSAIKDFQAFRALGLNPSAAWDVAEVFSGGLRESAAAKALAEGPTKLLPNLKSLVGQSLNPKLYLKDIGDAVKDWPGLKAALNPANAVDGLKGFLNPMTHIASSSFKTMALGGRALFTVSQTLPLAAGWGNLAPVAPGEGPATGPDLLGDIKKIPGLGANGIPFYNWNWTPAGG